MKIKEIKRTSTIAWSPDVIPLLASGSIAGAVDLDFSSSSALEIWDVFGLLPDTPVFSESVENKFHALAWLNPFENHPRGVLVGALENGTVQFWDVDKLMKTKSLSDASIHTSTKHLGVVKCLLFNSQQAHVLATGGQHSELFIWDLKTFAEPISPGRPTTPMDEISCISWNNAVSHILALTSNAGYTSIWDLKAKREVLHLAYTGAMGRADFSHVAWHPTQLTKLITASQSDACPLIMSWDLRNTTEPEKILQGHTKGVLSLDWCSQDPNLLISSGKDNSTRLWNPIKGVKLGDYPNATNWAFLTRFAPRAPDVIATASFDGKVVVQTLQETSKPVSEQVASKNDDDFWTTIAATDTQQATFEVSQAPNWLKRPCSVSFGFGSKLIVVKNEDDKGSIQIGKTESGNMKHEFADELSSAFKTKDFKGIIASKLENPKYDAPDWEMLLVLQKLGKSHLLLALIGEPQLVDSERSLKEIHSHEASLIEEDEDSFFANLSKDIQIQTGVGHDAPFVPAGEFLIVDELQTAGQSRLAKLLLSNKIREAVSVCLEEGKLVEALVLAMNEDESVKRKVKSQYFQLAQSDVLSRLIYSASSKDVVDIVSNANIANWKEIAASIAAYCKEEASFNSKIVELGDRIMASVADKENRKNALLCYLAGNALDKVAAIWLADLPDLENLILSSDRALVSSPHDAKYLALAGFVQKISVYRSLSNINGSLSGPSIQPVCKAVFDFSSMAASNGDFELANQILSLLPEDFAGLKSEKERIAKAMGNSAGAASKSASNGVSKTQNRYASKHKGSNVPLQPQTLGKPAQFGKPMPPVPPLTINTAMLPSQSLGYVPVTPNFAAPLNPYVPAGGEKRGSFGSSSFSPRNNSLGLSANPIALFAPTGLICPPSMPAFTQAAPQNSMHNTKAQGVPPPPVSNSEQKFRLETEGWNDLPETFKALKPSTRRPPASSAVVPPSPVLSAAQAQPPKRPQASHAIAPPPKLGSRSVSKSSVPGTPMISSSPRPSKYAPMMSTSPAQPANGFSSSSVPSPAQPSKATAPPKNPYEPAIVASSKTKYVIPPANNFVAPPTPVLSRVSSQAVNPYSPGARTNLQSFSNGSINGSHSQGISPPFAPPLRAVSGKYSSPQVHQSNGSGHEVSLGSTAKPVGPPPVSAAPSIAPPHISPATHDTPLLVSSVNPYAPSTTAATPVSAPPVAAPPVAAPPVAAPPVSLPHTLSGQPTHNAASNGQTGVAQSIKDTFSIILGKIKPAAPPKYAKHVLDMEKRLRILFDNLEKQGTLSVGAVELLHDVANSLTIKSYAQASAFNLRIGKEFPSDAGAWHTGVKRLITMAEAFEV